MSYTTESLQFLKQQTTGSVLTSDSPDYETTRRGWDLSIDHHPAVIVVAETAQDVVASVRFANENHLGIAIQSTGHGIQQPADDNLLIITKNIKAIQIVPTAQTARIGAGVLWKEVLEAAAPHSLAGLAGSSPHVGVVGYTLGGGFGWLGRKYGFAADKVRSVDIVTPDGVLRHASATENSDLFWGLLGGSGNFGVVTALEFELVPLKTFYGGNLIYPAEIAADVFRFFRAWAKTNPNEQASSVALFKFPNIPQLPDEIRGKQQVFMRGVYAGNAAEGAALIQPWLDWRAPLVNSFQEMPFTEIGVVSNDTVAPGAAYSSVEQFDTLSDEAIDLIVHAVLDNDSPYIYNEVRHGGGAYASAPNDTNAVGNRDAEFWLQMLGITPTPQAYAGAAAYTKQYKEKLRPYVRGSVYLNFMTGGESKERIKDAYLPESYERLVALKAKYDPQNLFRFSYQLVETEAVQK